MTKSSPQILKTRSSNRSSRPSLLPVLAPSQRPRQRLRQQRHHQRPSLPQPPLQPPALVPGLVAADLCRCARRSGDVPRMRRMRWVSSDSSGANRSVRPRRERLEPGRKVQNVSGYDSAQPAWLRHHLRCPPRHAQNQAQRTETRVRRGCTSFTTTVTYIML
jgi:hypothetical protein